jgi:hypothetical protein
VAEALLAAVKVELSDTVRERDNQMTAVAKLSSSFAAAEATSATAEEVLRASKAEVAELTERCVNLRTMNEELLGMLEGMYASQQGQGTTTTANDATTADATTGTTAKAATNEASS